MYNCVEYEDNEHIFYFEYRAQWKNSQYIEVDQIDVDDVRLDVELRGEQQFALHRLHFDHST